MTIVEKSQFKNEPIVKAALKNLFAIITRGKHPEILLLKVLLTEFLDKCCFETNSTKIQDQANELKLLLGLDWSKIRNLESENDFSEDFTLSYLDDIVVLALEQGAPAYDPSPLQIPRYYKFEFPSIFVTRLYYEFVNVMPRDREI